MNTNLNILMKSVKESSYVSVQDRENSNILRFLSAKTFSLLGTNLYTFALALYILKTTGSGTSFAINVLISMLPRILIGPFAGILADRVNKKKLTVVFDLISGGVMFSLAAFAQIYGLKIMFIYTANLFLSILNIFYDTAMNSAIPSLVSSKKLVKINSFTATSSSMAGILSPVIAGVIYSLVPIKLFIIVNGISFLISSILEIKIDFNYNSDEDRNTQCKITFQTVKQDFKDIWCFLKEQNELLHLLKYLLIINFFFHAFINVLYPYLINHVLHLASVQFGAFQAFYFAGMIVISVLIGNKKEQKNMNIGRGILLTGIISFLLGLPSLGVSVLTGNFIITIYNIFLIFTMGAALTSINIPAMVAIQRMTPEAMRGRIMGVLGILTAGIAPLGILLFGIIIDMVHPFILFSLSGICITITGLRLSRDKSLIFIQKSEAVQS